MYCKPAHGAAPALSPSSSPRVAACLTTVSSDVLACVLSFLYPRELRQVFPCARVTASLQHSDALWSGLLHSLYRIRRPVPAATSTVNTAPRPPPQPQLRVLQTLPPSASTRELFKLQYAEFPPRYYAHYGTVLQLCEQLVAFLATAAPLILDRLEPGVSEAEVRRVEAAMSGVGRLPLDWLLFLKLFNGQLPLGRLRGHHYSYNGIFGTIRYYHTIANVCTAPPHLHD